MKPLPGRGGRSPQALHMARQFLNLVFKQHVILHMYVSTATLLQFTSSPTKCRISEACSTILPASEAES